MYTDYLSCGILSKFVCGEVIRIAILLSWKTVKVAHSVTDVYLAEHLWTVGDESKSPYIITLKKDIFIYIFQFNHSYKIKYSNGKCW